MVIAVKLVRSLQGIHLGILISNHLSWYHISKIQTIWLKIDGVFVLINGNRSPNEFAQTLAMPLDEPIFPLLLGGRGRGFMNLIHLGMNEAAEEDSELSHLE